VGADRKGPLAAFVVIAIIAAVLLVTSVRSQAAPGWLDPDRIPASVVAVPPATDPHLWAAVTSGVDQVVRGGAAVVKRATSEDSDDPGGDGTEVALVSVTSSGSPTRHVGDSAHHGRHQGGADPGDQGGDEPSAPAEPSTPSAPSAPSAPAPHDHGRHRGWGHGHGQQGHHQTEDQGSGQAHDHELGHGHGHGH
jgi:hypothetical protein